MSPGVSQEIRNAAHLAHTLSCLAVDYEQMAKDFPWRRTHYLEEVERCRGEGGQWLDHAYDLRERYA